MESTIFTRNSYELELIEKYMPEFYDDICENPENFTDGDICDIARNLEREERSYDLIDLLDELQSEFGGKYTEPKRGLVIRIADHSASLNRVRNKIWNSETVTYSFIVGETKKQIECTNEWDLSNYSLENAIDFIQSKIDAFVEIED